MAEPGKGDDIALDDLMLAMDVADTLRHQQQLVARELDTEARDRALREKVRRIYAAQGIEVSDEIIARAVRSLRDRRFAYSPPPPGLATRLWHLYVRRSHWGKRLGAVLVALLAGWGVYWGAVELPRQRQLTQQAQAIQAAFSSAREQAELLDQRARRLQQRLDAAPPPPENLVRTANDLKQQAATGLQESRRLLHSARSLGAGDLPDAATLSQRKPALDRRLDEQRSLLNQAETRLQQARARIELLEALPHLPATLEELKQQVLEIARDEQAPPLARRLYRDGIQALKERRADEARAAVAGLRKLLATLRQQYIIQVVSRPGEKSGLWRYPDINRSARNYYLVVEAVAPDGSVLELPVRSEEDDSLRRVRKWGLRVSRRDYERIARDKSDDGIIQNRRVGEKQPGYLKPRYQVDTSGAAITQW